MDHSWPGQMSLLASQASAPTLGPQQKGWATLWAVGFPSADLKFGGPHWPPGAFLDEIVVTSSVSGVVLSSHQVTGLCASLREELSKI